MKLQLLYFVIVFLKVSGGLDEQFISNVLDEAYNLKSQDIKGKEQYFISKMWPEIAALIPESVKIPRFKETVGTSGYLVASAATIWPKVSDVLNMHFEDNEGQTYAIIESKLEFPKPVNFEIYKEDCFAHKSVPITVSYSFNGQNTVEFWIRIPDFSQTRDKITAECVIHIESFTIEKLSEHTINTLKDDAKEVEKQYWNSVKEVDVYIMMRIGITKGLLDKLQPNPSRDFKMGSRSKETLSVCISDQFKNNFFKDLCDNMDCGEESLDKDTPQGENNPSGILKRISNNDELTYIKINTLGFMGYIQFGIERAISSLYIQKKTDILMADFKTSESAIYNLDMKSGNNPKFTFITYGPTAFKHLRNFYGITEENFKTSFCQTPLFELTNPAKSGCGLYLSQNKYFLAKVVQPGEATFLIDFLPGYFLNIYQNPDTLLPKFFGFYFYKTPSWLSTDLRLIVMNNLLPPNIKIDKKYDLKGSTFQRELSDAESQNDSATFKDLDLIKHHPKGIYLKGDDYKRLMKTIQKDCIVLESFEIIDYSLLLSIHYEDRAEEESNDSSRDINHTPCENIQITPETPTNDQKNKFRYKHNDFGRGLSAWTANGEKLLLYFGIIDILQSYKFTRKVEYFWKSMTRGEDAVTIVEPITYARRFEDFMFKIFKVMPPCNEDIEMLLESEREAEKEKHQMNTLVDGLLETYIGNS